VTRTLAPRRGSRAAGAFEVLERRQLLAAIDVLTQHNDNSRTGLNLSETVLNTSNINQSTFGRLYSRAVDDQIYAQPLYVTGVNIPGKGVHDVVYVATVNNSVYCFDADDATAAAYWKVNFNDPANQVRPVFHTEVGQACGVYADFSGNIGIVGTPVIDKATNTIYFVARTVEGASKTFVQRLHALDITTGAEKLGGPVVINASVPGTGSGSSGGMVPFNPQTENQRPALTLANGKILIAWASHCDTGPYHGWVIAYNANNLTQAWAFCNTANGSNAGIWQSGQGLVVDSSGNIFVSCGNGTVNPAAGQYGESVLRISPTGQVLDYFIPNNYQQLENGDIDFGSGGPLLIPGTRTLVSADKEGKIFFLNADNLGGLNTPNRSLQEFQVTPNYASDKIHGAPVWFKDSNNNQWVYVWGSNDKLKQFPFNGTILSSTTPTFISNVTVNPNPSMPGGILAISSNGQTAGTGVLWATTVLSGNANNDVRPGVLRAFDATNVSIELWNSQQNATRDDFGNLAKFNVPTVDNGRVYLPTFSNQLVVYGLLNGLPAAPASLTATLAPSGVDVNLSWPAVSGAVQYTLERRSGSSGNFIPIATLNAPTTTYQDTGLQGGTMYTYRVRAQNSTGASSPAEASVNTVLTRQLLARYKFDETSGPTAADSSGNNNTATRGSGTSFTTAGKFAGGLSFDGTINAYAAVNDSPSLNPGTQITVSAWINSSTWAGGNRRILQKGANDNQYRLTDETDVLKWHIAGVGTVQTTLPSTGVWHLVVGTYDGSNLRLYIDGAQAASIAATGSMPVSTDQLVIGAKSPTATAGDHFNGTMDDVRVYNFALSATEVSTMFAGAAPATPTGLTLTAGSASNVSLTWNDVANNEAGYLVERRPAAGGAYAQVASLPANVTGYDDVGLPAATTFFYRVRAYNIFDNSAYTPEQSVTTQGAAIHSLVAYFKLDEASGSTLLDSSGHGVVPSLVGAPTHPTDTADASSHSLGLNGSTDWAQAPDNAALDMTDSLTLAAWVKADDWSQTRPILQKGGRETHYVLQADGGVLKFDLSLQGTLEAPLPTAGVWHHIAATYDGMSMKIFIDGQLAAQRAASGALGTTPEPFFIGGSHASSSTGLAFDGKIDDARVYNYALDPVDVSALYGNIAQLKFDDGSGPAANDSTPNNNDGALVNAPAWVYGRSGFALDFAGGQFVKLNNNQTLNPTAAISVSAWVNADDWTGAPTILRKGNASVQYRLFAIGGSLTFEIPGVGFVSTPAPSAGAWHMLTGTYNGSALRVYVDGAVAAGASASGAISTGSDTLVIGAPFEASPPANAMFHGLIDEVDIFGRGLTADEVQGLFAAPTVDLTPPTSAPGVFAYQTAPNAISFTFSEDVTSSVDALSIINLTTSTPVSPTGYSFDAATNTATFTLADPLPDGNYLATLDATQVHDLSGNALAANVTVDFFSLGGDANHDRKVDTLDFNALAANFGHIGATTAQGDFNHDGMVDTLDFNTLAANFGREVTPPADVSLAIATPVPAAASATRQLFGGRFSSTLVRDVLA
jgi:hypothetical protein